MLRVNIQPSRNHNRCYVAVSTSVRLGGETKTRDICRYQCPYVWLRDMVANVSSLNFLSAHFGIRVSGAGEQSSSHANVHTTCFSVFVHLKLTMN